MNGGPPPGDRLPDAKVLLRGKATTIHRELSGPQFRLLLCGPETSWASSTIMELETKFGALLSIHHLVRDGSESALVDPTGDALALLGVRDTASYVVRPDGHVSYRSEGADLSGASSHVSELIRVKV